MPDPDILTSHFVRSEFTCKCGCGFDTVDIGLLAVLESIRTHFDAPVSIRSGCRCEAHNRAERGKNRSQHLIGRAADFLVSGVPADEVQDFIEAAYPDRLGMGRYALFTHVDSRADKARW
jgi:uncharacterized protein YcbK (DUF882 family)